MSTTTLAKHSPHFTLREYVQQALERYLLQLDGIEIKNIYPMVIAEVEAALLETILQHTNDNQSKAAEILGLNRGTLRKKLKDYGINRSKKSET